MTVAPRLLSRSQVFEYLGGIAPTTLARWVAEGRVPGPIAGPVARIEAPGMIARTLLPLLVLAACAPTMEDNRRTEPTIIGLPGSPAEAADCIADQLDRTPLMPPLPDIFPPMVRRRGEARTVFLNLDSASIYVIDIETTPEGTQAKVFGGLREAVTGAVRRCA